MTKQSFEFCQGVEQGRLERQVEIDGLNQRIQRAYEILKYGNSKLDVSEKDDLLLIQASCAVATIMK